MDLLGKTRKINAMLQKAAGKPVNFKEMAETLCEVIESNQIAFQQDNLPAFYFQAGN